MTQVEKLANIARPTLFYNFLLFFFFFKEVPLRFPENYTYVYSPTWHLTSRLISSRAISRSSARDNKGTKAEATTNQEAFSRKVLDDAKSRALCISLSFF